MMKLFIFWKNLFLYDENSRLTCVSTRKFYLNFFLTNFSLWFQVKISNIWVSEIFCDLLKQTRGAAFAEKIREMWNNNCHVTSYTKKNSHTKPPNAYIRWKKVQVNHFRHTVLHTVCTYSKRFPFQNS